MVFLREMEYVNSMKTSPYTFELHTKAGEQPVWKVRNMLVDSALKSGADLFWFIDSDVQPPSNALEMLMIDADISSGVVPVLRSKESGRDMTIHANGYMYNVYGTYLYTSIKPAVNGPLLVDVDAAGTGAMLIHRKVFEDPRMELSREYEGLDGRPTKLPDDAPKPFFRMLYNPLGEIIRSEDLDFCTRAKECGYSIKYHFGIPFGHIKITNLNGVLTMAQDLALRHGDVAREVEARDKADEAAAQ
jgi:hypothetical protein